MKPTPERGDELVLTCRGCSKSNLMKIKSIKKNAQMKMEAGVIRLRLYVISAVL